MYKVIGWLVGLLLLVALIVLGGGCYLTEVALRPRFERDEATCLKAWG